MTTMNNNRQKQLYQEAGKYNQLNEVEQQEYWQKKQAEYDAMSTTEKELWTKATDENLCEIKEYLLTMSKKIEALKPTTV